MSSIWDEPSAPIAIPWPRSPCTLAPCTLAPWPRAIASQVPTGHRRGFASSKAPPVPPREHPLDYHPAVTCGCCGEKCLKLISWDDGYEGRRYFGCGNAWSCKDCNYQTWIDAPHSTFLGNLLSDLQNEIRRLKMENADGKQERCSMQTMYEARLRVKNNQLLKEEAAKEAALQALQKLVASRRTFRKQIGGSIAFAFAVGAVCGVWWKTGNS